MHWLEKWRQDRNLTRQQLADRVKRRGGGCSARLIEILEDGGVTHPEIAERIARVTGCTKERKQSMMPEEYRSMSPQERAELRQTRHAEAEESAMSIHRSRGDESQRQKVSKAVVRLDADGNELERFASVKAAAQHAGLNFDTIRDRCDRRLGQRGSELKKFGCTWRFAEEWDAMSAEERAADMQAASKGRKEKKTMCAVMTMKEYQQKAMRTSPRDGHDKMDNGILGLLGETGELVDVYKKWQFQSSADAEIPARQFAEELGDVLWYLVELADGMDESLEEISVDDFRALDQRMSKKGGRSASLRRLVTGLCWRANRLNRAAEKGEIREVKAQMRWMLTTAARLAWVIGFSLEEIARMNIEKLLRRYPDGFDAQISMGRYAK